MKKIIWAICIFFVNMTHISNTMHIIQGQFDIIDLNEKSVFLDLREIRLIIKDRLHNSFEVTFKKSSDYYKCTREKSILMKYDIRFKKYSELELDKNKFLEVQKLFDDE